MDKISNQINILKIPNFPIFEQLNQINENFKWLNDINKQFDFIKNVTKPIKNIFPLYENSILKNFNNSFFSEFFKLNFEIPNIAKSIEENPEYQFYNITQLSILSLYSNYNLVSNVDTEEIENEIMNFYKLLEFNVVPKLLEYNLYNLWQGAEFAINTEYSINPDKSRHCAISLRTIFESVLENIVVPNSKLQNLLLNAEFVNFLKSKNISEKQYNNKNKIQKPVRIEYINYQVELGLMKEFNSKDIEFINELYKVLCSVHNPEINLQNNHLKILKIKTGILIWLFLEIDEILNK